MPTYLHTCSECNQEFEDFYSINDPIPNTCPNCGKEGCVKRLINCTSKGVVELTGQDLVDKVKSDANKFKSDVHKSEKMYSNVLGEDRYQGLQKKIDRQKRDGLVKRK